MQSICDQLLYERAKDRRALNRLKFIWIERDPILMKEADFIRRTSSIGSIGSLEMEDYLSSHGSMSNIDVDLSDGDDDLDEASSPILEGEISDFVQRDRSINIASQLLSLLPPGRTTDAELEDLYESGHLKVDEDLGDVVSNTEGLVAQNEGVQGRLHSEDDDETSFAENSASWLLEAPPVVESLMKVVDMQVYLTGRSPVNETVPFARFGRPDIKEIFQEMKQEAIENGDNRVAVCVSAPKRLTDICQKACIVYSDKRVRFDFHCEAMAM